MLAVPARNQRRTYLPKFSDEIEEKIQAGTYQDCLYTRSRFGTTDSLEDAELTSVLITFLSGEIGTTVRSKPPNIRTP